jgi:hypothetical protein
MTITRTAKGTAINKTGALTLTLSSVELQPGQLLIVGISYDIGSGEPEILWGQRLCRPRRTVAGNGLVTRICSMIYRGDTARTRNIVATWTSTAPQAKALFATVVEAEVPFGAEDVDAAQAEALTTDPDSGTAVQTTEEDGFLIGAFGSEGPPADTVGTLQNGWSSGQRAGTAGPPPVSNITIHEGYKILTASEAAQAAKTGATERNWCTVLVAYKEAAAEFRTGITPTDVAAVTEIFEAAGRPIRNRAFKLNDLANRWEAYDVDMDTYGTLVAYQSGEWIEP